MSEHARRAVLGAGTGPTEDPGRSDTAPVRPHPIIDLSRPDRQPTQVMDLSRTLQLHTVRLEISEATLAELREAKAEATTPVVTPPPAAVPSLQSGDTLRIEVPRDTLRIEVPRDTLRIEVPRVRTLAFEVPRGLIQRPSASELANTLYDGGALRDRAVQLAAVRESESAAMPAECLATPPKRALSGALRRPLAAFRKSSWPKQLTIALLPLAIAGTWAMRDGSASASSAHSAASVRSPVPSAAPVPTSAAPTPSPSPVSTASSSANSSSERTLLEAAARPSDPSERLALIAAFSGNKAEAAALYDRLAATRNSRIFALAARLTREDRIRKP